jgi:hypothetical protein
MTTSGKGAPVRLIHLLKRKKGMTPEEFRHAYETGHSRHGLKKIGHLMLEYHRHYLGAGSTFDAAVAVGEDAAPVPYDVVTEILFRDMDALMECNKIIGDPETRRFFSEDEETLFDRRNCWTIIADTVTEDLKPFGGGRG